MSAMVYVRLSMTCNIAGFQKIAGFERSNDNAEGIKRCQKTKKKFAT